MYARAVDKSATELRELRSEELVDGGLAALAFGCSLAATQSAQTLALPLFAGALFLFFRTVQAWYLRWDLLERLLADCDAYAIREVRERAKSAASIKSRRSYATAIRRTLAAPGRTFSLADRVERCSEELAALAAELEDDRLELDPLAAVACNRLLTGGGESPLFDASLPADDLRAEIRRIRQGFTSRPHGVYS